MEHRTKSRKRQLPEPKRCAIYTRKSTSIGLDQEFNSLDAQREACEQYIQARSPDGWQKIPETYDDGGFSGANTARPAFQKLLDDVDAGKIDIILVYKVDRLSRSLLDFAQVMDRFNQKGVSFVSVTQNFSTADAMGRLTLNMLMSFAEFEREMIAERTRDKIAAARRKGKWTGGQVPLGYDVVDKHLVVNDLEAVVVREVFELYERHQSALTVAKQLNANDRKTKAGQNGRKTGGKEWNKDAVLRTLKNGIYAGYMPYGDELHDGEHEAIIDKNRYLRVQAHLEAHQKSGRRHGNNPEYLLSGLLRCEHCDAAMTPASTRKKGKVYRYYRCNKRDKNGAISCPTKQISAPAIEEFVVDRIREAAIGDQLADQITSAFKEKLDEKRQDLTTEREELPKKIAELSIKGRELVDKITEMNGVASKFVEDSLNEIGDQLAQAETRLRQVERDLAALDRAKLEGQWLAQSVQNFDVVWETMTPLNRSRLVSILVKAVNVSEENGTVTAVLTDLGLSDVEKSKTPPTSMSANKVEAVS